jgi:hypothetical protein
MKSKREYANRYMAIIAVCGMNTRSNTVVLIAATSKITSRPRIFFVSKVAFHSLSTLSLSNIAVKVTMAIVNGMAISKYMHAQ